MVSFKGCSRSAREDVNERETPAGLQSRFARGDQREMGRQDAAKSQQTAPRVSQTAAKRMRWAVHEIAKTDDGLRTRTLS